jgi:anthranilate phosphoribosyltransferase
VANFFRETGGRALLMHGTEGEVYANPQRCPQISLIDDQGVRVLYERQTEAAAEVVLPASKDPEVTARWIERCVAGVEPVPHSLKIQLPAVCWPAARSQPWSRVSAASTTAGDRIGRIKKPVRWLGRARQGY